MEMPELDLSIVVALIGAAATVVAALVARKPGEEKLAVPLPITSQRKACLQGEWRGTIEQMDESIGTRVHDVEMVIHVKGDLILATARILRIWDSDEVMNLDMRGSFYYDRFLRLNYENVSSGTTQFGATVIELKAQPDTLKGKFCGFGSRSERIVVGDILLERVT